MRALLFFIGFFAFSMPAHAEDERFLSESDVISVKDRPNSYYQPLGISVRSFLLRPGMEIEGRYDDNIFRSAANAQSDVITTVNPSVALNSNWNRHDLNVRAHGAFGRYTDNSNEDFNDYGFYMGGRYDIGHQTYLSGSLQHEKTHEDRGDPNDAGGDEPTDIKTLSGRVGFTKRRGFMRLKLDALALDRSFEDTNIGAVVVDNSDRNRFEQLYMGELGLELSPNYEAFMRYGFVDVNYDNLTNGLVSRDSTGHEITLGSAVDISGKVKGELFAGYMNRAYQSPLSDIGALKYGGSLLWNLNGLTSMKLDLDRGIQEIDSGQASGYVRTEGSLVFEHALRRNVIVDANMGFRDDKYKGNGRSDDTLLLGLNVIYKLFRGATLGVGYNYVERDSNIAGADYTNNRFMLTGEFTY